MSKNSKWGVWVGVKGKSEMQGNTLTYNALKGGTKAKWWDVMGGGHGR